LAKITVLFFKRQKIVLISLKRQWEPNIEKEFHRHEYTADAIVIEGEFWLTVEGKTRHLNPGDSFHVPAQVEHKEKYGVAGYVFWVAKV